MVFKPELQTANKKLRPSTASKLNTFKSQFLPLGANDSDTIEELLRIAYNSQLSKQNNE